MNHPLDANSQRLPAKMIPASNLQPRLVLSSYPPSRNQAPRSLTGCLEIFGLDHQPPQFALTLPQVPAKPPQILVDSVTCHNCPFPLEPYFPGNKSILDNRLATSMEGSPH